MKKTLRRFCLSTVLCGTVLLAAMQQGVAQSASASSRILRTTPQSVEDLQRIEHQLQAVLPKVLSALVCIQVNNSSGTGILVSEKGLIFSAAHVVGKKDTVLKIILPDGTRIPGKTTAENSDSDAGIAEISTRLNKNLPIVEKAENRPQVGDWVFALGHGGGLDRKRGPMVAPGTDRFLEKRCHPDGLQTHPRRFRRPAFQPERGINRYSQPGRFRSGRQSARSHERV